MKRLALEATCCRSLIGCTITGGCYHYQDEIKAIQIELNQRYQVGDKSANLISALLIRL
jgi:hypothetical protein